MGIAYSVYEDNALAYTLYPISFSQNDVQIKRIDDSLRKELMKKGLTFSGYYRENPIKVRHYDYAIELVERETLRALKYRLLAFENEFLVSEFVFAFIDKFRIQLGLDKKDTYAIGEIENAFYNYLPTWIFDAIKFMVQVNRNGTTSPRFLMYGRNYFDPDLLLPQLMAKKREQIHQSVIKKLELGQIATLPLGNEKISFRKFNELVELLKTKNVKEIARPYLPKDYSRLKDSGWIWNLFSPDVLEKNLEIFFANLPKAYFDMVELNFPELINKIPLFKDSSLLVIIFNAKEKYARIQDSPTIEFFGLRNEKDDSLRIELARKVDDKTSARE